MHAQPALGALLREVSGDGGTEQKCQGGAGSWVRTVLPHLHIFRSHLSHCTSQNVWDIKCLCLVLHRRQKQINKIGWLEATAWLLEVRKWLKEEWKMRLVPVFGSSFYHYFYQFWALFAIHIEFLFDLHSSVEAKGWMWCRSPSSVGSKRSFRMRLMAVFIHISFEYQLSLGD